MKYYDKLVISVNIELNEISEYGLRLISAMWSITPNKWNTVYFNSYIKKATEENEKTIEEYLSQVQ